MKHLSYVACLVADGWGRHVAQHARRRIDLRPYLRELANPDDRCGAVGPLAEVATQVDTSDHSMEATKYVMPA